MVLSPKSGLGAVCAVPVKNICSFLLFAASLAACGAELAVDSVSVQRGSETIATVRLNAGASRVVALQFDAECNPAISLTGSVGLVAAGAEKTLYSARMGSGRTRFLLMGVNGNTLSDGAAVQVSVAADSTVLPGNYPLRLRNALASDVEGFEIPLTDADGSVTVSEAVTNLTPSGIFTHVAAGEGWKTSFTLMNLAATESQARLVFWDDSGNALRLPFGFPSNPRLSPTTGTAVDVTIPRDGVVVIEAGRPDQLPVRVGWAQLHAPSGVVGWATFGQQFDSGYAVEAVVPMETRTASGMILPSDNSNGFSTGVAMANPSDTASANIRMIFRDADGQELFADMLSLPARGHGSFSLPEKYPNLVGTIGSLELQNLTGGPISALGLRFNRGGSITSISPAPK